MLVLLCLPPVFNNLHRVVHQRLEKDLKVADRDAVLLQASL